MEYKPEYPVKTLIIIVENGLQRVGEYNPLCTALISGMPVDYWLCEIGKVAVYLNDKDAQNYLIKLLLTSRNNNCRALAVEWLTNIKYLKNGVLLYWEVVKRIARFRMMVSNFVRL